MPRGSGGERVVATPASASPGPVECPSDCVIIRPLRSRNPGVERPSARTPGTPGWPSGRTPGCSPSGPPESPRGPPWGRWRSTWWGREAGPALWRCAAGARASQLEGGGTGGGRPARRGGATHQLVPHQ